MKSKRLLFPFQDYFFFAQASVGFSGNTIHDASLKFFKKEISVTTHSLNFPQLTLSMKFSLSLFAWIKFDTLKIGF